jgi:hypothetical protein
MIKFLLKYTFVDSWAPAGRTLGIGGAPPPGGGGGGCFFVFGIFIFGMDFVFYGARAGVKLGIGPPPPGGFLEKIKIEEKKKIYYQILIRIKNTSKVFLCLNT